MRPAQHSRNPPVFCGSIVSTTCFKTVPQELQLTCAENVERANRDGNMRVSAENRCYQANGRCKGELLPEGDLLVLFCGEVDEQILMVQGAPYTQSSACSPLCSRDTGSGDGCDGKCSHVAREARCPALCLLSNAAAAGSPGTDRIQIAKRSAKRDTDRLQKRHQPWKPRQRSVKIRY